MLRRIRYLLSNQDSIEVEPHARGNQHSRQQRNSDPEVRSRKIGRHFWFNCRRSLVFLTTHGASPPAHQATHSQSSMPTTRAELPLSSLFQPPAKGPSTTDLLTAAR